MDIHFDIPDIGRFQQAADAAPKIVSKNMRIAMSESVKQVRDLAMMRHRFVSRTGALVKSVKSEVDFNDTDGIAGRVFLDESVAPYGKFVHDGTGICAGHQAWVVTPKNKKALRWASGGKWVFAKYAKHLLGSKPDQFIYEAGRLKQDKINEIFAQCTNRAIQEAGF